VSSRDDASRDRRIAWGSRFGVVVLRTLASTWRVRFLNPEVVRGVHGSGNRVIYVLWHGDLLPLLWSHRKRDIAVIISEHSDGEIIARIAHSLGFRTVRGSTTRGAARALLGACREVDAGHDLAVTVDGPRGPAKTVAPGSSVIAQRTGAAMVPVAAWASRAWRLKSWDRFMIPKPFARVTVVYDNPIRVAADAAREAIEERERVRAGIERAGQAAAAQ
jgi:lysophospholipid acyltransferase (LPLAT)-like uncharacterized protein